MERAGGYPDGKPRMEKKGGAKTGEGKLSEGERLRSGQGLQMREKSGARVGF